MPPKKKPDWRFSKAKQLLWKDVVKERVTEHSDPSEVFLMRKEYFPFKDKFAQYLEALLEKRASEQALADATSAAIANDRIARGPPANARGYPIFQGSEAERLLQLDMDLDKHNEFEPKELYGQREEYQEWPLTVFRNHIHQELRKRIEGKYWKEYKQERFQKKKY